MTLLYWLALVPLPLWLSKCSLSYRLPFWLDTLLFLGGVASLAWGLANLLSR